MLKRNEQLSHDVPAHHVPHTESQVSECGHHVPQPLQSTDPPCGQVPLCHPSCGQDVQSLTSLPGLTEGPCGQSPACLSTGHSVSKEKGTDAEHKQAWWVQGAHPPRGPASKEQGGGKKPGLLGTWPIGLAPPLAAITASCPETGMWQKWGQGLLGGLVQGGMGWGSCLAAPQLSLSEGGDGQLPLQETGGPGCLSSEFGTGHVSLEEGGCLCLSTWPSFLSSTSVPSREGVGLEPRRA